GGAKLEGNGRNRPTDKPGRADRRESFQRDAHKGPLTCTRLRARHGRAIPRISPWNRSLESANPAGSALWLPCLSRPAVTDRAIAGGGVLWGARGLGDALGQGAQPGERLADRPV